MTDVERCLRSRVPAPSSSGWAALLAVLALTLTGCLLGNKPAQKAAKPAPATPAPVAKTPPPSRPQPLSIPQTQAQLPAPQPISPEALATTQPAEPRPEIPPAQRSTRRPPAAAPAPAGQARTEPPPAPAPPAAATAPADRPPVQEIINPAETRRLLESAEVRRQEVRKVLAELQGRNLTRDQNALVPRIKAFLLQSEEAQRRNDPRLADALAQRAQVLARELPSAAR